MSVAIYNYVTIHTRLGIPISHKNSFCRFIYLLVVYFEAFENPSEAMPAKENANSKGMVTDEAGF